VRERLNPPSSTSPPRVSLGPHASRTLSAAAMASYSYVQKEMPGPTLARIPPYHTPRSGQPSRTAPLGARVAFPALPHQAPSRLPVSDAPRAQIASSQEVQREEGRSSQRRRRLSPLFSVSASLSQYQAKRHRSLIPFALFLNSASAAVDLIGSVI
jgi:hypothetical protein